MATYEEGTKVQTVKVQILPAVGETYTYLDGPLADGDYTWRVLAYDVVGREATSNLVFETVSSAPEPPTDLSASYNNGTKTLTLSWTHSVSSDRDHYNVRSSAGADDVNLESAPVDTPATNEYTQVFTNETGRYVFRISTVDGDGKESASLEPMAYIDLENAQQVQLPNEPTILRAEAIEDGEVRVLVQYDRTGEQGVATLVNLYANDGAGGAMDWNTSKGTTSLSSQVTVQAVEVESSGLSAGKTYEVGVRAKTAGAVEDTNTNTIEVTTFGADLDSPILSAELF